MSAIPEDIDAAFAALTADITDMEMQWPAPELGPAELERILIDGSAVMLDGQRGEVFRQIVLGQFEQLLLEDARRVPVEKSSARSIEDILIEKVLLAELPLTQGDGFVARGTGILTLQTPDGCKADMITPDRAMHGHVLAVAYLEHYGPAPPQLRDPELPENVLQVAAMPADVVVALTDVVMYETTGIGMVDLRTDFAFLPLRNTDLRLFAADWPS